MTIGHGVSPKGYLKEYKILAEAVLSLMMTIDNPFGSRSRQTTFFSAVKQILAPFADMDSSSFFIPTVTPMLLFLHFLEG